MLELLMTHLALGVVSCLTVHFILSKQKGKLANKELVFQEVTQRRTKANIK